MEQTYNLMRQQIENPILKLTRILMVLLLIQFLSGCSSNQEENRTKSVGETFMVPKDWIETKIPEKGITISCPANWELGDPNPNITNIYWVGLPHFETEGNVTLSIIPWNYAVNFSSITKTDYKKDLLSSSFAYSDLKFEIYDSNFIVDSNPALFAYFKAQGKLIDKDYQEVIFQVLHNNSLFTLRCQYSAPPKFTALEIDLLKTVAKSIKFRD
jgi:hypothetical protein